MHTKLSTAAVATGAAMAGHAGHAAAQQRIAITLRARSSRASSSYAAHVRPDRARLRHEPLLLDPALQAARRTGDRDRQPARDVRGQTRDVRLAGANRVDRPREGLRDQNGTWKILRATDAYAHLEGHGRVAIVDRSRSRTAWPTALRASSIWAGESMNKLIVSITLLGTTALLAATGADAASPSQARPERGAVVQRAEGTCRLRPPAGLPPGRTGRDHRERRLRSSEQVPGASAPAAVLGAARAGLVRFSVRFFCPLPSPRGTWRLAQKPREQQVCPFLSVAVTSRRVLAMQKVVGSSPIIRFNKCPAQAGFSVAFAVASPDLERPRRIRNEGTVEPWARVDAAWNGR